MIYIKIWKSVRYVVDKLWFTTKDVVEHDLDEWLIYTMINKEYANCFTSFIYVFSASINKIFFCIHLKQYIHFVEVYRQCGGISTMWGYIEKCGGYIDNVGV